MVDRNLVTPVTASIPVLLFTIALIVSSFAVARYLDAMEEIDVHAIDAMYLTPLDLYQRGQYQEYRHHRVYPDPAARWVKSEQELRELKQWIKQHDMAIQVALSHANSGEYAQSFKNWLH